MDQVSRSFVPRERFAELLGRPRRRGSVGDPDVHDTAALVRQDHEHKQEPARRSGHDEEVGGRDLEFC